MDRPDDEIVRLARGNLVQVEMWQRSLRDAGIDSRVVGDDLTTSFGSALTGSIELWVRRDDFPRADEILRATEAGEAPGEEPAEE